MPLFETWEARTLDVRMRAFADPKRADPSIVIVAIDQKSLDAVSVAYAQGWPWSRDYYAIVLTYLFGADARAVAFDFVFSEPSIYTQKGLADDDADLAKAGGRRPVVHAVMLTREGAKADKTWAPGFGPRLAPPIEQPFDYRLADPFDKATLPIEPILRATRALGSIGFEPDDDGTLRAIRPSVAYRPGGAGPAVEIRAFPLALAAVGGARVTLGAGRVPRLTVDGRQIPLDGEGHMLLRFHGAEGTYDEFSYMDVLHAAKQKAEGKTPDPDAGPAKFRDKFVIVGAKAAGLLDLRVTPMRSVTPGYFIHATALDNFLHGDPLRRVPLAGRVAAALVLGVIAGAIVVGLTVRPGAFTAAGLILLHATAAVVVFQTRNVWVDVVVPTLAMGLAYAGGTGYAYLTEGRERRFLKGAFARYLAPEVVDALVASPERLALGGETRELTVMFVDVAGFTGLSEGRKPEEVVAVMNEYFNELTGVIQGEGGTVDKFIGDAVMAFWNAPVRQADHAARASRAAREIHEGIERVNQRLKAKNLPSLSARVGVATGEALVGNVGSSTKFNYTAMGDTVNLASRLEGAAKQFHTTTLVAGSTAAAANSAVPFRELDLIQVKGRAEPVPIYTIEGGAVDGPRAEARAVFARALAAYRARDFAGAARDFDAAAKLDPGDGPAQTLAERAREFMVTPPPAGWRGEFQLTSK